MFDFAPIGLPAIVVGIAYMLFVGRRLLPRRVRNGSPLQGCTLAQAGLGRELGVNVIAIVQDGTSRIAPPPTERLRSGADVFMQAREEQLVPLRAWV